MMAAPVRATGPSSDEHIVSLNAPESYAAEQYRSLRHTVELRRRQTGLQVLAVTSPADGDGKTTTAINLAVALAGVSEAKVLIMDADLRRSVLAERLGHGAPQLPGLVDVVLDFRGPLAELIRPGPLPNLALLPAGRPAAAPYEVLKSPRLEELLDQARRWYDWIVVDTPPLVVVPDCGLIQGCVDGFLIVVSAHRTPRVLVGEALRAIDPAKVVGLVFNRDDRALFGYSRRYYGPYVASGRRKPGGWSRRGRTDPGRPGLIRAARRVSLTSPDLGAGVFPMGECGTALNCVSTARAPH
jgi:protein-tyrosine kinase